MSMVDEQSWTVYLIRNNRNALYCGVTNNLQRRFKQHESGRGAKALKGKGPLTLVWSCVLENKRTAMKAEYFIKQLSKTKKEQLVDKVAEIVVNEGQTFYFSRLCMVSS